MLAAIHPFGAQALTFAIPVGTFVAVLLWGYFQRRPTS